MVEHQVTKDQNASWLSASMPLATSYTRHCHASALHTWGIRWVLYQPEWCHQEHSQKRKPHPRWLQRQSRCRRWLLALLLGFVWSWQDQREWAASVAALLISRCLHDLLVFPAEAATECHSATPDPSTGTSSTWSLSNVHASSTACEDFGLIISLHSQHPPVQEWTLDNVCQPRAEAEHFPHAMSSPHPWHDLELQSAIIQVRARAGLPTVFIIYLFIYFVIRPRAGDNTIGL